MTTGQQFRNQRTLADHIMRAVLCIAGVVISICALTVIGYYVKDVAQLVIEVLK